MTQTKKRLGLNVPLRLYDALVHEVDFYGITINSFCMDIFIEYFKSQSTTVDQTMIIKEK